MALQPYNIKTTVYCTSEAEARSVQKAVDDITKGVPIKGSEILNFYGNLKENMVEFRSILNEIIKKGFMAIISNGMRIKKLIGG